MKQTKKYVVAITGTKKEGRDLSIITYLSPVLFQETQEQAKGIAFSYFMDRNPGYGIHSYVISEI